MISRSNLQTAVWTMALIVGAALCFALMLQVKGVKSDIAATERAILSTKHELMALETEFQTRARQQQLVRWNEVEFGYVAPKAAQFFETRYELAALGKPVVIEPVAPIRMADAGEVVEQSETAAPTRLAAASAAPVGMMRQLVARDEATRSDAEVVATPKLPPVKLEPTRLAPMKPAPSKPEPVQSPRNFADRFDLESVIAGTEGGD